MSWKATAWAKECRVGGPALKGLLLIMADYHHPKTGKCVPGQDTLADDSEQSVRTVQRQLRKLERIGCFDRYRRFNSDGTRSSDGYILHIDRIIDVRDGEFSTGSERPHDNLSGGQSEPDETGTDEVVDNDDHLTNEGVTTRQPERDDHLTQLWRTNGDRTSRGEPTSRPSSSTVPPPPPRRSPDDDDDFSDLRVIADECRGNLEHARQVRRDILGRAGGPVGNPLRYVLTAIWAEPERYRAQALDDGGPTPPLTCDHGIPKSPNPRVSNGCPRCEAEADGGPDSEVA